MSLPGQNNHLTASLIKSAIRVFGYGLLFLAHNGAISAAAGMLIFAELVGVIEELV